MNTEEREKVIKNFFDNVLKMSSDKRNMKKLNEEINYYFESLEMKEISGFDSEVNFEDEREVIDVLKEKVVFIHCLFIGQDYKELTDNDYIDMMKKNPLLEYLASYKMEKYGAEVLSELGLELVDLTKEGFLVREKENIVKN